MLVYTVQRKQFEKYFRHEDANNYPSEVNKFQKGVRIGIILEWNRRPTAVTDSLESFQALLSGSPPGLLSSLVASTKCT